MSLRYKDSVNRGAPNVAPDSKHAPRKRLALFFDGTWNEPPDHTNVRRLRLMLAEHGDDGMPQEPSTIAASAPLVRQLTGGLIGSGLSENVATATAG